MKCPKCNNDMVDGYLQDHDFFGIIATKLSWTKSWKRNLIKITRIKTSETKSFACIKCGFIETYLVNPDICTK